MVAGFHAMKRAIRWYVDAVRIVYGRVWPYIPPLVPYFVLGASWVILTHFELFDLRNVAIPFFGTLVALEQLFDVLDRSVKVQHGQKKLKESCRSKRGTWQFKEAGSDEWVELPKGSFDPYEKDSDGRYVHAPRIYVSPTGFVAPVRRPEHELPPNE